MCCNLWAHLRVSVVCWSWNSVALSGFTRGTTGECQFGSELLSNEDQCTRAQYFWVVPPHIATSTSMASTPWSTSTSTSSSSTISLEWFRHSLSSLNFVAAKIGWVGGGAIPFITFSLDSYRVMGAIASLRLGRPGWSNILEHLASNSEFNPLKNWMNLFSSIHFFTQATQLESGNSKGNQHEPTKLLTQQQSLSQIAPTIWDHGGSLQFQPSTSHW